jgi:hypothetical protein
MYAALRIDDCPAAAAALFVLLQPGFLRPQLPDRAPQQPEPWQDIKQDFYDKLMRGESNFCYMCYVTYDIKPWQRSDKAGAPSYAGSIAAALALYLQQNASALLSYQTAGPCPFLLKQPLLLLKLLLLLLALLLLQACCTGRAPTSLRGLRATRVAPASWLRC